MKTEQTSNKEFIIGTDAPQCNRMTVTGQDTDNKRTIYKYINRQCIKWQKHNMQYRQLCVRSDMCKFEKISMCGE